MPVFKCRFNNSTFTTSSNRWRMVNKTSSLINNARSSNNDNTVNPIPNIIKLYSHETTVGRRELETPEALF